MGWMKSHNENLSELPFTYRGFSRSLALTLGLTPGEVEQLSSAYLQTKKNFDDLAIRSAAGKISADGKILVITVPSLTGESAPLYSNLLDTVKQVLGPDRYSLFNELAGDGFDRTFDRFGLNPVTYELTLEPEKIEGGFARYPLKTSYIDVSREGSRGWGTGTVTRADLQENNPVIAHFFTPDIGK